MEQVNSLLKEDFCIKLFRAKVKKVSFGDGTKEESNDANERKKWNEKKDDLKKGKFTPDEVETLKHSICRYAHVMRSLLDI